MNEPIADFKKKLEARRPLDNFAMTLIQAVQHVDQSTSPNKVEAFHCLEGCVACHDRQDESAAWLLLYLSGALLEPKLVLATRTAIAMATRQPIVPVPPVRMPT